MSTHISSDPNDPNDQHDPNVPNDPNESGIALLVVLLMLTLALALVGGFVTTLVTDQQLRSVDQSRTQVFYAAHGALERLTADLGNTFMANAAPTVADLNALTAVEPVFGHVVFDDPDGGTGYQIQYPQAGGVPVAQVRAITSGPFQGFTGLVTPYTLAVTARSAEATNVSSEVRLERTLQTVAIPLFQFGVFSETDLSYFPGPNFNFGGRVHTNGNLFLATGNGSTLTMADRVTAVREVIRTNLSNGFDTTVQYPGTVTIARAPGVFRVLDRLEGSLVGTLGSAQREPGWTNMSIGAYNGYLRNGRTGARRLDLPFVTLGATPIDLIRRGIPAENPMVLSQRYYSLASLRILLSDTAADLTGLPGVTATAPVSLQDAAALFNAVPLAQSQGNASVAATAATAVGGAVITVGAGNTAAFPAAGQLIVSTDAAETPANRMIVSYTNKTASTFTGVTGVTTAIAIGRQVRMPYRTPAGTQLNGGFIKIELQRANQTWLDVTAEILGLGVSGVNVAGNAAASPAGCVVASNAVIRIQRLRDNPIGGTGVPGNGGARCGNGSANASDYWPNTLYDTREANLRDNVNTANLPISLGGVMHVVELDVNNLRQWFAGAIGVNGVNARSVNGYTVYFSDRRTNRNAANVETGDYGFEDFVNPADANGVPNGALDVGEDVNGNGALDTYGQTPQPVGGENGAYTAGLNPRPWTLVNALEGKANRSLFFRRALKLVNGTLGSLPMPGLTVVAENPVYVQGHYNANAAGFGAGNAAAAVMGDAVTLLSSAWNDNTSYASPNNPGGRVAATTWYRMAILAGKGQSFPQPAVGAPPQDFGTDGGVHNFLRYLENWGGQQLNYRGSIGSFFFNRQAVGTYKCCTNVYNPPTRAYAFDVLFLQPNLLPPFTPMFRDLDTTGFTQVIR